MVPALGLPSNFRRCRLPRLQRRPRRRLGFDAGAAASPAPGAAGGAAPGAPGGAGASTPAKDTVPSDDEGGDELLSPERGDSVRSGVVTLTVETLPSEGRA